MPLFGPPDIDKFKATRDIPGLIKALKYKNDYRIRIYAINGLADIIDDPRVVPALYTALADEEIKVRERALYGLTRLQTVLEPFAIHQLLGCLNEHWALSALQNMGDPVLAPVLDNITYAVNQRQAEIARIDEDLFPGFREMVQEYIDGYNKTIVILLGLLNQVHSPEGASSLNYLLNDDNEEIRDATAKAMASMGWQPEGTDESMIPFYLSTDQWSVLSEIGESAIQPAIEAFRDCCDEIKNLPSNSYLQSEELSKTYKRLFNRKTELLELLGRIGDDRVVYLLINEFNLGKPDQSDSAKSSLVAILALATLISENRVINPKTSINPIAAALDKYWISSYGGYQIVDDYGHIIGNEEGKPEDYRYVRWVTGYDRNSLLSVLGMIGDQSVIDLFVRETKAQKYSIILKDGKVGELNYPISDGDLSSHARIAKEALQKLGWNG